MAQHRLRSIPVLVFSILVLGVLVSAAPAGAALPRTSDHLILINKSIGGVAPGMTIREVKHLWGPQGAFGKDGAYYSSPGNQRQEQETGLDPAAASALYFEGGKAFQVGISTALQEVTQSMSKPIFDTPLSSYHTRAGIHLGSPGPAVKKAYPQVKTRRFHEGREPIVEYRIPAQEDFYTAFTVRSGRVSDIVIEAGKFVS